MPKSADPAAPPEPSFYAPASPPFLGNPATDPPMTVRVENWDRRFERDVRRVIKNGYAGYGPNGKWFIVTGPLDIATDAMSTRVLLDDEDVADWPIAHPTTYTTAFRHQEARRAQEKAADELAINQKITGDMGAEAFKGGT